MAGRLPAAARTKSPLHVVPRGAAGPAAAVGGHPDAAHSGVARRGDRGGGKRCTARRGRPGSDRHRTRRRGGDPGRDALSGGLSAGGGADCGSHAPAAAAHPKASARGRSVPDGGGHGGEDPPAGGVVLLPEADLRLARGPRGGDASHHRPRTEPHPPPPFARTDRHGDDEGTAVVEPLRVDRRADADRGRGVRGRSRRAAGWIRPRTIHAHPLPPDVRL